MKMGRVVRVSNCIWALVLMCGLLAISTLQSAAQRTEPQALEQALTIACPAIPSQNPQQIAMKRWYPAIHSSQTTFHVGSGSILFDGDSIWVADFQTSHLTKVRPSDGSVLGTFDTIPIPNIFSVIALAYDGANVWVASNNGFNGVTKVRASDGAVLGSFPTNAAYDIAFDGVSMWVTNATAGQITKIKVSTGQILGTFNVGTFAQDPFKIIFDGNNLWVSLLEGSAVVKLRPSDGSVVGTFPVGSLPRGLAFDGANIWVANSGSNTVTKLRASDGVTLGTFAVGNSPDSVVFDGANIWISNDGSNTVTKLRACDGASLGTFAAGLAPTYMSFDGANIWIAIANNSVMKM